MKPDGREIRRCGRARVYGVLLKVRAADRRVQPERRASARIEQHLFVIAPGQDAFRLSSWSLTTSAAVRAILAAINDVAGRTSMSPKESRGIQGGTISCTASPVHIARQVFMEFNPFRSLPYILSTPTLACACDFSIRPINASKRGSLLSAAHSGFARNHGRFSLPRLMARSSHLNA